MEDIQDPTIRNCAAAVGHITRNDQNVAGFELMRFSADSQFEHAVKQIDDLFVVVSMFWQFRILQNRPKRKRHVVGMNETACEARDNLFRFDFIKRNRIFERIIQGLYQRSGCRWKSKTVITEMFVLLFLISGIEHDARFAQQVMNRAAF